MAIQAISTTDAPPAIGPYSQGIRMGNLIFVSGQLPIKLDGLLVEGDITAQAHQIFQNIKAILLADSLSLRHVVKTTCYLTSLENFDAFNTVYAHYFIAPYPARATVGVQSLPKGAKLEIECIATTAL